MEVRSKILKDERPSRPESEKKHSLTTELWRMFALCWGKDPGSRVSASEVLNLLQHLWVLTSPAWVFSVDSPYDSRPPQRSGPCNLKTVTLQGEDQANQERIDKLDEGGHQLSLTAAPDPRLIVDHRCWTQAWYMTKRDPNC